MIYNNEELNIKIKNSEYFEIKNLKFSVELFVDGIKKYTIHENSKIEVFDKSKIYTYNYSKVYAYDNSIIHAHDNSTVKAYDKSAVYAWDNSTVKAYDNSTIYAFDKSEIKAYDKSIAETYKNSKIYASDNSIVEAYNSSIVYASDDSIVYASDNSIVEAYNYSTIKAYDNSTIHADEFSCIYKKSTKCEIIKNNHYGSVIEQVFKAKNKMRVYKKLREDKIAILELKAGQVFQSEFQSKCRTNEALVIAIESIDGEEKFNIGYSKLDASFKYEVGQVVSTNYNKKIKECSRGIHFFLTRKAAEHY